MTETRRNINNSTQIVFRHYVTYNKGQLEFVRPKCREIWMRDLGKNDGSIQSGYRPVFILSNNKNNTYSTTVNVFPLTTKVNKKKLPVHVDIWDYEKYGLTSPSTILVEQPMTVEMNKFSKCIGNIDDINILNEICAAMSIQFPIITFT